MMRQVQIVNLNSSNGYLYTTAPSGLSSFSPSTYTNQQYGAYIVHSMQAASMKACADDIIKFYDDNDNLISVFKMMPGMVVQFL